jgi:hypothetical protein
MNGRAHPRKSDGWGSANGSIGLILSALLRGLASMSSSKNSRVFVFWLVVGMTLLVWALRGIGLLTFVPGFVLGLLIAASIALLIINGWIETR